MRRESLLSLACGVMLVGCVATPNLIVGPDHPANADASEIELPLSSTLLAATGSVPEPRVSDVTPAATQPSDSPSAAPPASENSIYTCPMHAEVVSDQPGRCPKCKMKLVKKEVHR